jgi:hypothetical protein
MDAIVAAVFEIGYQQTRRGRVNLLPRLAYHAGYIALTPFLGVQAADDFTDGKLRDSASPGTAPVRTAPAG